MRMIFSSCVVISGEVIFLWADLLVVSPNWNHVNITSTWSWSYKSKIKSTSSNEWSSLEGSREHLPSQYHTPDNKLSCFLHGLQLHFYFAYHSFQRIMNYQMQLLKPTQESLSVLVLKVVCCWSSCYNDNKSKSTHENMTGLLASLDVMLIKWQTNKEDQKQTKEYT